MAEETRNDEKMDDKTRLELHELKTSMDAMTQSYLTDRLKAEGRQTLRKAGLNEKMISIINTTDEAVFRDQMQRLTGGK